MVFYQNALVFLSAEKFGRFHIENENALVDKKRPEKRVVIIARKTNPESYNILCIGARYFEIPGD